MKLMPLLFIITIFAASTSCTSTKSLATVKPITLSQYEINKIKIQNEIELKKDRELALQKVMEYEKGQKAKKDKIKERVVIKQSLIKKEREERQLQIDRLAAAEKHKKFTIEYRLQEAVESISDAKFRIKAAQKAIDYENRIGDRTGYVNKYRIYDAGKHLIAYEDVLKESYKDYKSAGGKLKLKDIK